MAGKKSNIALVAAIGAAAGAVAGFVTGILTAPKSGKETRADIKDNTVKAKKHVVKTAGQVRSKAEDIAGDVVDTAKDLQRRAGNAVEGAKKAGNKPKSKK
jgi:gas vesicle protein